MAAPNGPPLTEDAAAELIAHTLDAIGPVRLTDARALAETLTLDQLSRIAQGLDDARVVVLTVRSRAVTAALRREG